MKKFLFGPFSLNHDLAAFMLRLLLGGLMAWHGWMKIDNYNTYVGMMQDFIGIGGRNSYNLVIFAEFVCGLLVVIGFLTRLAVIPMIISMSVAYFMAHAKDPFQNKEIVFMFLALAIIVFVVGSGRLSVDYLIYNRNRKYA